MLEITRYQAAATSSSGTGSKIRAAISRVAMLYTSNAYGTAVTSDVVFNKLISSLPVGGMITRMACGNTVRRMACDAAVLPAVLNGGGQVLDVGRTRRLFTGPLRRALAIRDRGCAFPGCDRPVRWTDGHHIISWLNGGTTDVDNGVLVCRVHHGLVHDANGWRVRLGTDKLPEFIPPPWIDPDQRPLRNTRHAARSP